MAVSVNIKQLDGTLKKIAGNTILLDATCSEIRSGAFSIQCVGNFAANSSITFETPMSDTDYVVIFESNSPAAGEIGFRNKTTTGFDLYVLGGRGDTEVYTFTGNYYAFRLVELEGYNAIYNKMTNIDSTPTDNSTNLVTSGGVYDAIKNASSVFIGTSSEWESETSKTDYQVAILTDQPNVNAVDSTDGSTTVVGEPNKRWVGSQNGWSNLTAAEKAKYEVVCFTDDAAGSFTEDYIRDIADEEANKLLNAQRGTIDCDTTLKAGVYSCAPETYNRPTGVDWGVLMVFGQQTELASSSTQWIYQFFYDTSGRMFKRMCINPNSLTPNTWSVWREIKDSSQVKRGTLALSGTVGTSGAYYTVTVTTPMPDTDYSVNLTLSSNTPYWAEQVFTVQNKTVNGFTILQWNNSAYDFDASASSIDWIALS